MSRQRPLRLFLDSNVVTGGIVSEWGLDKAVLSLCAARICRMVLAEYVSEEVEENLLSRAAELSPADAEAATRRCVAGQSQRDCASKPKVAVLGYLGTGFEPGPTPKGLRLTRFK